MHNLQWVVDKDQTPDDLLKKLNTGAAVQAVGTLIESQGGGQSTELVVEELVLLGEADPDEFPIQMKRHSLDFLREKAHLRFRTNTFGAVFRVRHVLQYAVHSFFHERGSTSFTPPSSRGATPRRGRDVPRHHLGRRESAARRRRLGGRQPGRSSARNPT